VTDDDGMPPDPFPPTIVPGAARVGSAGTITVMVEAVPTNIDNPDLAEWCSSCLLPSAVGYRFRILANGVPLSTAVHLIVCPDCGTAERRTD
jgi:hypothetical protein